METLDDKIRLAAFSWLKEQTQIHGDVLSIESLRNGFVFENERIPLLAPQGIFKPRLAHGINWWQKLFKQNIGLF